jgi:hypothetical protein
MRVSDKVTEQNATPSNPLTSHDLRLCEFTLPSNMDCESGLYESIIFPTDPLPILTKTNPSEDVAGDGAERHNTMALTAVAFNHLAHPPVENHDSILIRDVASEPKIPVGLLKHIIQLYRKRSASLAETCP